MKLRVLVVAFLFASLTSLAMADGLKMPIRPSSTSAVPGRSNTIMSTSGSVTG